MKPCVYLPPAVMVFLPFPGKHELAAPPSPGAGKAFSPDSNCNVLSDVKQES
jgi:hypothetical protein